MLANLPVHCILILNMQKAVVPAALVMHLASLQKVYVNRYMLFDWLNVLSLWILWQFKMKVVCVCFQVPTVHQDNHTMCPNGSAHLLTLYIIPDFFLLSAYLYGLFVIRVAMPDHLSTFVETVSMCTLIKSAFCDFLYHVLRYTKIMFPCSVIWIPLLGLIPCLHILLVLYFVKQLYYQW